MAKRRLPNPQNERAKDRAREAAAQAIQRAVHFIARHTTFSTGLVIPAPSVGSTRITDQLERAPPPTNHLAEFARIRTAFVENLRL
jgi:hypothetical protein